MTALRVAAAAGVVVATFWIAAAESSRAPGLLVFVLPAVASLIPWPGYRPGEAGLLVLACTLAVVAAVLLDGEGRENHPALVAAVVLAVYGAIAGSLTLAALTLRRAIQR